MTAAAEVLAALLARRRPDALVALRPAGGLAAASAFDRIAFEAGFAAAGRRLGTEAVGESITVADAAGRTWSIAGWGLDEVGRALLLLDAAPVLPAAAQVEWLDAIYRAAALRERQAVVRTLALLPDPERFLAIALDACRTSTQPIFEAIACENPYPAAFFPEASFNQMALKAVFTEVALRRILGLATRRTPELARMADDYASERRAAGRSVPGDLGLLGATGGDAR